MTEITKKNAVCKRCHWEPQTKFSTPKQASDYCKKDGHFLEHGEWYVQCMELLATQTGEIVYTATGEALLRADLVSSDSDDGEFSEFDSDSDFDEVPESELKRCKRYASEEACEFYSCGHCQGCIDAETSEVNCNYNSKSSNPMHNGQYTHPELFEAPGQ